MDTQSRVALVTGAGSGIGRAVAIAMLQDGYCVALLGRRQAPLEETAALANVPADRVLILPADVSDPESVRAAFAKLKAHFGRLDVLFNNAGVSAFAASV